MTSRNERLAALEGEEHLDEYTVEVHGFGHKAVVKVRALNTEHAVERALAEMAAQAGDLEGRRTPFAFRRKGRPSAPTDSSPSPRARR
jgi:hypothetical protein